MTERNAFVAGKQPFITDDIARYLGNLSFPDGERKFRTVTDTTGNRVYEPEGIEDTPLGSRSSCIIVSKEGRALITRNHGLLRRLHEAGNLGKIIGRGSEGTVFQLPLDTADRVKDFAVKYTFPVYRPTDGITFWTPACDQMRILQRLRSDRPDLNVITPVLSSLNVMVSEQVPSPITFQDIYTFVKARSGDRSQMIELMPISKEDRGKLAEMIESNSSFGELDMIDDQFYTLSSYSFIGAYYRSKYFTLVGLSGWFQMVEDELELISPNVSTVEIENPGNLIISVPEMYALYQRVQKGEIVLSSSEFMKFARATCRICEATVGVVGNDVYEVPIKTEPLE